MDIKNITDFFRRKGVDTLSERAVFGMVTGSEGTTEDVGMKNMVEKMYGVRAQQPEQDDEEREVDDEVFRQQYIPQTLQQVYDIERDATALQQGD
ncbi:Serine/threonine-protein kinase rio1, partial [Friedmanniomyces endolithicus]